MEQACYDAYLRILHAELVPALGCTEPIAIAYAAAKARAVLGEMPEHIALQCSGNIIKNVKGVTVPHSGGRKGMDTAAVLGVVGGDADCALEVLEKITPQHIAQAQSLLCAGFCSCMLAEGEENLYIAARVTKGGHSAQVIIAGGHTNIISIEKDGETLFSNAAPVKPQEVSAQKPGTQRCETDSVRAAQSEDKALLNVQDILVFAACVKPEDVSEVLERQIALNTAIAREGMEHPYGAQVGRTLLEVYGNDVKIRARAYAAAGSDARMCGCGMPVVINSGSGNQGITVCVPVVEYAQEMGVSRETLYRALVISNLISIHQKRYIGSLSAYCGAVTAATGAGAAITYLNGGTYADIACTITNTVANVGGIVCDGAKPSCAAKIASAVDAAILAHHLGKADCTFQPGEGIVCDDIERTIKSMGHIGRVGMRTTDTEILNLMIDKVELE